MFHVEHVARDIDVVVVGGGHAGCEAAAAAARRGARTLLVTMEPAMVGAMSCNPAIGGVGKGHLVREVDVFGGLIARAADRAAIHYRMLNRSRGPAVWGPRVQADRRRFARAVQAALAAEPQLSVMAGEVSSLDVAGGRIAGVALTCGTHVPCRAVVLATGTFLRGRMFCGEDRQSGGRVGERAATRLAAQLTELSPVARLKTGTPPRLDGRTIDWARLPRQESDAVAWRMAPWSSGLRNVQVACGITRTNPATHDVIRAAMTRSPLGRGDIVGVAPRYCPSIEDKVRRFGDREGHQIFLEPEGLDTHLVYPNGISTSLSRPDQIAFVRTIAGLEDVEIVESGYAVEYDMLDPRQLDRRLSHREVDGLFLAGQVNGTTGYEEAAAQGLVAGLNAAGVAAGLEPVQFSRADSYIGVLVDDLTLQGVTEPYRMLTARAEHRLHLRADNAEARLFEQADLTGCLLPDAREAGRVRQQRRAALMQQDDGTSDALAEEVRTTRRYAPYVTRALSQVRAAEAADLPIPASLCYDDVPALSVEMRSRLAAARPRTTGDAARLAGITPAAITALMIACRKHAA